VRAASEAEESGDAAADTASAGPAPPLEIRLGSELAAAWKDEQAAMSERIASLRRAHEQDYGIGFPAVRMADGSGLGSNEYEIRMFGARFGLAEIHADRTLAIRDGRSDVRIDGIETRDPAFGLPALWVDAAGAEQARQAGLKLIDPVTVLITHFADIVQSEVPTLLTRAVVVRLLEEARERQPGLVEELVPNGLSISDIQRVLQNLLAEGVSVANFDLILEHLADLSRTQKDPGELTELVRQRLSYSICNQLRGRHQDLAVLSLDPRLENQIAANLSQAGPQTTLIVEPRTADQLIRKLSAQSDAMYREGRAPVLLCGGEVRRHIKAFTRRSIPKLAVLSINEIPMRISLRSYDVVKVEA
jgi:flagellar biosynthesis protein FlhA